MGSSTPRKVPEITAVNRGLMFSHHLEMLDVPLPLVILDGQITHSWDKTH